MLAVDGLQAHYGRAHILQSVSFTIDRGDILVLLGRNGTGKSTTLKAIMGLVPPSGGRIAFAGTDIAGMMSYRIAQLGIGYVPEERRVFSG